MRVKTVTSGRAAIKPPNLSLRLAVSEIKTTKPAVIAYLKIIQGIVYSVIELINQKRITKHMRHFNSILALLLVLLLPTQSFAAATNSLCHQIPTSAHETQATQEEGHACHHAPKQYSHSDHQKEKNHCVSACGQLNMAVITIAVSTELAEFTQSYVVASSEAYHSVSLPKFQKPPIQIS